MLISVPASTSQLIPEMTSKASKVEGGGGMATRARKRPREGGEGPKVQWEWEGDGGRWNTYGPEQSKKTTEALVAGNKEVLLKVSAGVDMRVRFLAMTQMNTGTGWQRDVRCVPSSSSAGGKGEGEGERGAWLWEWKDEGGTWNTYSPATCRLLEAAHQCGMACVGFEAGGRDYELDLKGLCQINPETGVTRPVQRVGTSSATTATTTVAG